MRNTLELFSNLIATVATELLRDQRGERWPNYKGPLYYKDEDGEQQEVTAFTICVRTKDGTGHEMHRVVDPAGSSTMAQALDLHKANVVTHLFKHIDDENMQLMVLSLILDYAEEKYPEIVTGEKDAD
jgi:hypothetical protein